MIEPQLFNRVVVFAHILMYFIYGGIGILASYGIQSQPKSNFYLDYDQKKENWIFIFQ
jgi:hypothetical protein